MATRVCADCGGPLGANATVCPQCGQRYRVDGEVPIQRADNTPDKLDLIYERLDKLTTYAGWFWWLLIGIPLIAGIVFLILAIIKENHS